MERKLALFVKKRVKDELPDLQGDDLAPEEKEQIIKETYRRMITSRDFEIEDAEIERLETEIINDCLYYGILQPLLDDPTITEIMVNGGGEISRDTWGLPTTYIERDGKLYAATDVVFDSANQLMGIINKIAEDAGVRCDTAAAIGCAMLPGGKARASFSLPPLAADGAALDLRKFKEDMLSLDDLVQGGTLTSTMAAFLTSVMKARCPLFISGGTGTGKTTLLNALSELIPPEDRVITIEQIPELHLRIPHVLSLKTREKNTVGTGEVTIRDLMKHALVNRPDRIIVGECRGPEALDMLQAMQTDHPGSMTTFHANGPDNAISRLATMVGYADGEMSERTILQQISSALAGGLIIHLWREHESGKRRIVNIVAIYPIQSGSTDFQSEELFFYEKPRTVDGITNPGTWVACGKQPTLIRQKILEAGLEYDPQWFFGDSNGYDPTNFDDRTSVQARVGTQDSIGTNYSSNNEYQLYQVHGWGETFMGEQTLQRSQQKTHHEAESYQDWEA